MPHQYADTDHEQRKQIHAVCRLQEDEQEYANVQEDEEVEKGTGTYFIIESADNAVYGTDHEQDEKIAERDQLPKAQFFQRVDPLEVYQFGKRLVEQFHLSVEESMSQQKPVGKGQSDQGSAETPDGQRLERVASYQPDRDEKEELGK